MIIGSTAVILGTICMTGALLYIVATWRNWQAVRVAAKLSASTAFVVLAVVNGAVGSTYGRLVLLALILSWAGDLLLLSLKSTFLLAGMAVFFLAHLAFAAAFISRSTNNEWFLISLLILGGVGLALLRWLWSYLGSVYRIAVPFYLAAIMIMASLAVAASAASTSPLLAVAASIFTASDVSVARDRFVAPGVVNKVWGLPMYYAAQLLFAMSVPA